LIKVEGKISKQMLPVLLGYLAQLGYLGQLGYLRLYNDQRKLF